MTCRLVVHVACTGKNGFDKTLLIDPSDHKLLGDRNVYANSGYPCMSIDGQPVYVHKLVFEASGRTLKAGETIDHIDRNPFNNCRDNLRAATKQEQMLNRRLPRNNKSGFRGVSWCNRDRKWLAHIRRDGKGKKIGLFDTPEEAAAAYNKAAQDWATTRSVAAQNITVQNITFQNVTINVTK